MDCVICGKKVSRGRRYTRSWKSDILPTTEVGGFHHLKGFALLPEAQIRTGLTEPCEVTSSFTEKALTVTDQHIHRLSPQGRERLKGEVRLTDPVLRDTPRFPSVVLRKPLDALRLVGKTPLRKYKLDGFLPSSGKVAWDRKKRLPRNH